MDALDEVTTGGSPSVCKSPTPQSKRSPKPKRKQPVVEDEAIELQDQINNLRKRLCTLKEIAAMKQADNLAKYVDLEEGMKKMKDIGASQVDVVREDLAHTWAQNLKKFNALKGKLFQSIIPPTDNNA